MSPPPTVNVYLLCHKPTSAVTLQSPPKHTVPLSLSPLRVELRTLQNPQGDPCAVDGWVRPEGTDDDLDL